MNQTAVSLAVFWGPLALLITALLAYGIRRDRVRSTRIPVAVAVVCVLVLTVTAVVVGWGVYQQQGAERDACTPCTDC